MKWLIICFLFINAANASDLPVGNTTAEGVAADMARAFIEADEELWRNTVFDLSTAEYKEFVDYIADQMNQQSNLPLNQRTGPKEILIVYKMGRLSKNGPNSYSYAFLNLDEIGFVDVGVISHQGEKSIVRTFVMKKGERWYAFPRPDLSPLLTDGLNEETRPEEYVYLKQ